eukprot:CAMPEP_0175149498 /NCGR_PEP_ID=MMETSP0087-20121206/17284_1 /TAXON_ID=136419 /ORGANISM="Unknown Unknown, Strain D1" /LENGTH=512 /DNA_ID=CAMNT_0016435211 /DNA_START=34 /DNA_END=1569 /DNA_ORIENTATION=-
MKSVGSALENEPHRSSNLDPAEIGEETIAVVVRVRGGLPPSPNQVFELDNNKLTITGSTAGNAHKKDFSFDRVFDQDTTQARLYKSCANEIVQSALDGFNATIFAYGQTGAGKTHTMSGSLNSPAEFGVIPNAIQQIFRTISKASKQAQDQEVKFLVSVSYLEIYNEHVHDLLADDYKDNLQVRECDGCFFVPSLTKSVACSEADALTLIEKGWQVRSTAATEMNHTSSRSHSILTFYIEKRTQSRNSALLSTVVSKLNLVDLAGSERHQASDELHFKESVNINQSLSTLANVISALSQAEKRTHIPYRDSKLTRLLKDSIGGNSKTLMIACVSPTQHNLKESVSTLRYASSAKKVWNRPTVNRDIIDATLKDLKQEIEQLRLALNEEKRKHAGSSSSSSSSSAEGRVCMEVLLPLFGAVSALASCLREHKARGRDKDAKHDKVDTQTYKDQIKEALRSFFRLVSAIGPALDKAAVVQFKADFSPVCKDILSRLQNAASLATSAAAAAAAAA